MPDLDWGSTEGLPLDDLKPLYYQRDEVRDVLQRLFGLTVKPFHQAMGYAWLEWSNRSEFDAPSFPGELLWGHTVRHERRILNERSWVKDDTNNFSTSISPDGRMAIAVETGDRLTATTISGKRPRTNSRKGPRTLEMLRENRAALQGNLFSGFGAAKPSLGTAPLLWIHLIHQTMGDIASEISLPIVANAHQRIVGWRTRIVLPRWRGGHEGLALRSAPEAAEEATVRVVRRQG